MTPFNVFLLLVVIIAAALGFRSGLVKQAGSMAAIIIGVIACRMLGDRGTAWLQTVAGDDSSPLLIIVLAYAGIFLLAYFAVTMLVNLVHCVVNVAHLGLIDRLAGAAFKVLLWCFVLSIALNVWAGFMPESRPQGAWAECVEALAPAVMGMNIRDRIG